MTDIRDAAPIAQISWDNTGAFTGTYDDLSARILKGDGTLTVSRGRDTAQTLAPTKLPEGSVQVRNDDAIISPENAGSPLFGLIEPGLGHPAVLSADATGQDEIEYDAAIDYDAAVDYDGPVSFTLLTGILSDLDDNVDRFVHTGQLDFLGGTAKLRTQISTTLYQDILVSDAIGHLLDAVGWPSGARQIATSDTTLSWWWLDNADAFSALNALVATEGAPAIWFEAANGDLVFQNRTWRATQTRSLSPQAEILDIYGAATGPGDLYHNGVTLEPGWRDVRNKATIKIAYRAEQSLQKVWEFGQSLVLAANESRTITAPLSDPCLSATAPASGTDYTVAAGSLASSPTISNVKAQSVDILFTASASGATLNGVTSNGPQLRARPVTVIGSENVTNSVDASASIAKRGLKPIALDQELSARPEIARGTAVSICDAAVTQYQSPPSILSVLLQNIDYAHLVRQMTFEVSDRIAVTSTPRGMVGTEAWVEQVEHQRASDLWRTTLTCSRAVFTPGAGTWDGSGIWGLSTWAS